MASLINNIKVGGAFTTIQNKKARNLMTSGFFTTIGISKNSKIKAFGKFESGVPMIYRDEHFQIFQVTQSLGFFEIPFWN